MVMVQAGDRVKIKQGAAPSYAYLAGDDGQIIGEVIRVEELPNRSLFKRYTHLVRIRVSLEGYRDHNLWFYEDELEPET